MRTLTPEYKELSEKAGRYPLLKIEIYEGERGKWTENIIKTFSGSDSIKNATYTSGSTIKPSKFETGVAYCSQFTAVLSSDVYADLKYSQKIKVYTGFKDIEKGSEEYIALGVFYIESKELRSEGAYISARDIMMYSEKSWFPYEIEYPCTLTDVYKDVVRQMGGTVDESYTLPVDAEVLEMPYMPSDPNVIYVYGETELDGKPYTCRQMIAQIAKIQLGNAYVDGDGYIKFYSYEGVGDVNDNRITEIRIEDEKYSNLGVFYAYGDRTQEQVKSEETYGTIVFFTTLPIVDLYGEAYDKLREQAAKACGWWWSGGQISRKGQGTAEPGDKIEYSGKYGDINFFVSGVVMEWVNGSFDETIYSFAPTYEDSAYSSNNTDAAPSEVEGEATSGEGGSGVTIENAVIIQEADAKYLLHKYTEVEYISGNKIGYAGAQNQIIVQGYVFNYTDLAFPEKAPYTGVTFAKSSASETGAIVENAEFYLDYNDITTSSANVTMKCDEYNYYTSSRTTYDMSITGIYLKWNSINAPNSNFPYGYIYGQVVLLFKYSSTATYMSDGGSKYLYIPFASEAEYNAAVGLTYEPNVLTAVNETVTEV